MDIHHSYIRDFIMPKEKSVYVVDYYEGINGVLASRDEYPYPNLFANPRIRTNTEITWATDAFSSQPTLLSDLTGDEKERYAYELRCRLVALQNLIAALKEEKDGEDLSKLLSKAIGYIDEKSVYCGDGEVILVNWGLIPRAQNVGGGGIYRSGKFIGKWGTTAPHVTPQSDVVLKDPEPEEKSEDTHPEKEVPDKASVDENPVETKTPDNPDKPVRIGEHVDVKEHEEESPVQKYEEEPVRVQKEEAAHEPEVNPKQEEKEAEEEEKKEETPQKPVKEGKEEAEHKKTGKYSWRTFWLNLWEGLKFLLRKLGWLLLLIILFFLIAYLFKGCQGPFSQINPFYNPLPEKSVVLPIEKGETCLSSDKTTRIAADRLNIILENGNYDNMLKWAKAFKKEYSSSDYEIFYYNTDLQNLQIKVPADKREQVKREIKDKLKGFNFDVFDEIVYDGKDVSFNDPALSNVDYSWYLKAIGAYDAWQVTTGSPEVTVAVVDNGFDLTHPEFKGKIVSPYNILTQDSNVRPVFTKEGINAHGTHVAATAVGNANNHLGLLGIAPRCKLMPVQVANDNPDGSISTLAIIEGVLYAIKNGADVVNVSLGLYANDFTKHLPEAQQLNIANNTGRQEEALWDKVFAKAEEYNCIIVLAAGNDDVVSGIDPGKRSQKSIIVSAVGTRLAKADFSNFGRYPQINKEYSTVSAPGENIYSAAPYGKFVMMNGTSMSSPIVAGTVALLKSIDKNITVEQVADVLKRTGHEVNPKIGPLIDLGRAVRLVGGAPGEEKKERQSCDDICRQVRELQSKIDSLKRLCPDAAAEPDTLKYKDAVKNNRGLDGLWMTTTTLYATATGTPIKLYMKFNKLRGQLIIKHQGLDFTAPLTANITGGKIFIKQHDEARCAGTQNTFVPYTYNCSADSRGNLTCTATSATNTVVFNLVRVN